MVAIPVNFNGRLPFNQRQIEVGVHSGHVLTFPRYSGSGLGELHHLLYAATGVCTYHGLMGCGLSDAMTANKKLYSSASSFID